MVHFGILYISGRRWGPKRRGAGKVYSAECGNLKRCILRNFTWGTFRKLHLTSGERASRFFREKRGTCRQSLWHCDCWHNTSTLHTVNYPTWSGVINKLKFDHLLKKKKAYCDISPDGLPLRHDQRQPKNSAQIGLLTKKLPPWRWPRRLLSCFISKDFMFYDLAHDIKHFCRPKNIMILGDKYQLHNK